MTRITGDTITKVIVYYADLEESSPWARRELIITMTTLCLSLPLSLHNGMAKFARVSLISLIVTSFVLVTIIIRLFTLGPLVYAFCLTILNYHRVILRRFSFKIFI